MWDQIVEQKHQWIGGRLVDYGDCTDIGVTPQETTIVDIELTDTHMWICGRRFSCGGSRMFVGVNPHRRVEHGIAFVGYGGHEFSIQRRPACRTSAATGSTPSTKTGIETASA